MSKSYDTKADKIQADGKIPVCSHQSGLLTYAVGAAYSAPWIAPCDLYIERFFYNILVTPTSATATVGLGTQADDSAYVNSFNVQNAAPGFYELDLTNAAVVSRTIPRGTVIRFGLDAASAVGTVAIGAVLRPL